MTQSAFYMDGQTARRQKVGLSHGNRTLVISDEWGECLASWETEKIFPLEKVKPGKTLVLGCSSKGNSRLKIEDRETQVWLFNILPGLSQRSDHSEETRLAWMLSGGLIIFITLLYLSLPYFTQSIVSFFPIEWERRIFEGSATNVARSLGANQKCTGSDGNDVLKRSLQRLVGEKKAKQISIIVVESKMVNAFAAPGNELIVMSALIDEAVGPDEVLGVLAHELGHVEERHVMQAVVRGAGLSFVLSLLSSGNLIDMAGLLAETSYSRDHERSADQYALKALKQADIKTEGLVAFFKKMDKDKKTQESLLRFISTHPMSSERAEVLSRQKGGGPGLSPADWKSLKSICVEKDPL